MAETKEGIKLKEKIEVARGDSIIIAIVFMAAIVFFAYADEPMLRMFAWYPAVILGIGLLVNLIRLAALMNHGVQASDYPSEITYVEPSEDAQSDAPPATIEFLWWRAMNDTFLLAGFLVLSVLLASKQWDFIHILGIGLIIVRGWQRVVSAGFRTMHPKALITLALLITSLGVIGYHISAGTFSTKTGTPGLAQVSAVTGLRFPSGTRVANSYSRVFITSYQCLAILELKPGEMKAFLNNINQDIIGRGSASFSDTDHEFTKDYAAFYHIPKPDWWDAESAHKWTSVWVQYDEANVDMVINEDNPRKPRVYIAVDGCFGWIPSRRVTPNPSLLIRQ